MKRPILFAIAAVVAVSACFYWKLAPNRGTLPQERPIANVVGNSSALIVTVPQSAVSATASVSHAIKPRTFTEEREQILDAPDVMKTVEEIRLRGTQDQKSLASLLLMTCKQIIAKSQQQGAANSPPESDSTKALGTNQLAEEQANARKSLLSKCSGVNQVTGDDYTSLRSELVAGSRANQSVLGQLHTITFNQDDRWSPDKVRLVTDALYSGDPIVVRAAQYAVESAVDLNAPGGQDRTAALEHAFEIGDQPLSDFERTSACYLIDRCSSNSESWQDHGTPSSNVVRLTEEYRAALRTHMDSVGLLSIR